LSRSVDPSADSMVRVMTWNIHGAVGRNPRFDLERVVALVQRHQPDIVALQEIDSRRAREAHIDNPFDVLQKVLGGHGVGAKTVTTADGDYGQALISRWPMVNTEIHDLSFPGREPRRAICSDIQTPAGPLRVIATHLGLSFHERHAQVIAILKMLGSLSTTTVALGDFNDWLWAGSVRRRLGRVLPGYTNYRTFPSRWPIFHLDRVYLWPREALVGSHTDPEARAISDHLPVISDIRVRP
jgi:endonuclease/exonuclease/phosphatase family metal-dependent hydrolase